MRYRVRAYLNADTTFKGSYKPGDRIRPSIVAAISVEAGSEIEAAEQLYAWLNEDSRINGPVERSLCVGDVIAVKSPLNISTVALGVAHVGFEVVELAHKSSDLAAYEPDVDAPWEGPDPYIGPAVERAAILNRYEARIAQLGGDWESIQRARASYAPAVAMTEGFEDTFIDPKRSAARA